MEVTGSTIKKKALDKKQLMGGQRTAPRTCLAARERQGEGRERTGRERKDETKTQRDLHPLPSQWTVDIILFNYKLN